jgi:PIN domain nuclease of toxin-antitoxin system
LKLLLDTHVLLWTISTPERIPVAVRRAIAAPGNSAYVSVVCLWEIAIKVRKGRLEAPDNLPAVIAGIPHFTILPVSAEHAWRVRQLGLLHRDPFDHLLVAQAQIEEMTVVTHDREIERYGVPVLAV